MLSYSHVQMWDIYSLLSQYIRTNRPNRHQNDPLDLRVNLTLTITLTLALTLSLNPIPNAIVLIDT